MTALPFSEFGRFRRFVRMLGGVWSREDDVHFSQHRDSYTAAYKPDYPDDGPEDSVISLRHWDKRWEGRGPHATGVQYVHEREVPTA